MNVATKTWGRCEDPPSGYRVKSGMTTMTESTAERFDPREEKSHFDDGNGRVWDGRKTMMGCKVGISGGAEV